MKTSPQRQSGFTLLEILIALLIFGVIAGTLFIAYRALYIDTGRFDKSTSRYALAQACFQRIITDLSAIKITTAPVYTAPERDEPSDPNRIFGQTALSGDAAFGTLRFASLAHVSLQGRHPAGIAEIRYYVREETGRKFTLRRSDHLYLFPDFRETDAHPVLCEDVKSLKFTYYDAEGRPHENWDSDSADYNFATPVSIAVELEIGDDETSTVFMRRIVLPVVRSVTG